jgi:hypothetical protein
VRGLGDEASSLGCDEQCESRTQGVLVSNRYGRDRGR